MKRIFISAILSLLLAASSADAKNIVFDISHRVIFHPESEKELGLRTFMERFIEAGNMVAVRSEPLTRSSLEETTLLILPGSMMPYNKDETEMIRNFVQNGGRLLVLLHIAPPLSAVTEPFGIFLSNAVISESANLLHESSQDFFVEDIKPHPLTRGVKRIALLGSWGLLAEGGTTVLASTTDHAWGDFNRNRKYDKGEPMQKIGVVALSMYGRGKVLVIADDAPLANAFINLGDNSRLADNIVEWMTK